MSFVCSAITSVPKNLFLFLMKHWRRLSRSWTANLNVRDVKLNKYLITRRKPTMCRFYSYLTLGFSFRGNIGDIWVLDYKILNIIMSKVHVCRKYTKFVHTHVMKYLKIDEKFISPFQVKNNMSFHFLLKCGSLFFSLRKTGKPATCSQALTGPHTVIFWTVLNWDWTTVYVHIRRAWYYSNIRALTIFFCQPQDKILPYILSVDDLCSQNDRLSDFN